MAQADRWVHTAGATAEGGHVHTDGGGLDSRLASPLAAHSNGLTPEQLLAAAFAACLHHAAVEAAADLTDEAHTVQVRVETSLGRDPDGRYLAEVDATVACAGLSRDQLADLVGYADRLWPFSSADRRHTVRVAPVEDRRH